MSRHTRKTLIELIMLGLLVLCLFALAAFPSYFWVPLVGVLIAGVAHFIDECDVIVMQAMGLGSMVDDAEDMPWMCRWFGHRMHFDTCNVAGPTHCARRGCGHAEPGIVWPRA